MKKVFKAKKVVLRTFYNLNGRYIPFADNDLNGKIGYNVKVVINEEARTMGNLEYDVDTVKIDGFEPIECELVDCKKADDGTLEISICQDWG